MRPKSEIYTPKPDDEHPHPFHMRSPPPGCRTFLPGLGYGPLLISNESMSSPGSRYRHVRVTKKHENEGKNWQIGGEFSLFE